MKTFFQLREETTGKTLKVSKDIYEAAQQMMNESSDQAASQKHMNKLAKKEGHIDDPEHVGSHGHEHVYATGESEGTDEYTPYAVHNTKTNKVHKVTLDHNGIRMSHKEVHNNIKRHDPKGNISAGARKHIYNHHQDERDDYEH